MKRAITGCLTVVIALVLAAPRGARAEGDVGVGVVVTGDGSMQPQLAAQIERWLSGHGHRLVASPLPPEAITQLIDCFVLEDQGCARGVVEQRAKSSSLVFARVDAKNNASNGTLDVTLTAYWLAKGADAVVQTTTCQPCTDQSLRSAADEIMKRLAGDGGEGQVKLRSTPVGARITIDGEAIGVTPLDWDLPAGKHTIEMELQGYEPSLRKITVVANTSRELTLELEHPRHDHQGSVWRRFGPPALTIGGAALLVGGGVMIAVDQDRVGSEEPEIHNTAPAGVGMMIGGAIVGGVGAYLWFFRHESQSAPIAAFTGSSGYVGWVRRF